MRRACKFRVYPTSGQVSGAALCLRDHQRLYNAGLEERRETWKQRKVSVRYGQQLRPAQGHPGVRPGSGTLVVFLPAGHAAAFRQGDGGVLQAMQGGPEGPGYPRFRALDRWDSVEWPKDGDGCRWKPGIGRVYLQGIGHVKVRAHRPVQGRVKTITLKREGRRWFVVLSCDDVPVCFSLLVTGRQVGIDVGVARFATTSDGEVISNPRFGRESAAELTAAQQVIACKKRGSSNSRRARAKVAAVRRRIRNRRADFHHKTARALVQTCDVIALEDLRITNMTRRPAPKPDPDQPGAYLPNGAEAKAGLNKSILDAAPGTSSSTSSRVKRKRLTGESCLWTPGTPASPATGAAPNAPAPGRTP